MIIENKLPKPIEDNVERFIVFTTGAIQHSDPEAKITIQKDLNNDFSVSVLPSNIEFKSSIINNLLYVHKHMKIKITFSKSLERSRYISYTIKFV